MITKAIILLHDSPGFSADDEMAFRRYCRAEDIDLLAVLRFVGSRHCRALENLVRLVSQHDERIDVFIEQSSYLVPNHLLTCSVLGTLELVKGIRVHAYNFDETTGILDKHILCNMDLLARSQSYSKSILTLVKRNPFESLESPT